MQDKISLLQCCPLFSGIEPADIPAILQCLEARSAVYAKKDSILRAGESTSSLGLLLTGHASLVQEDFWGNRSILAIIQPGQLFAEAFACLPGAVLTVDVRAVDASEVLFLNTRRLLNPCGSACAFHRRMLCNLLSEMAEKNRHLNEKVTHMAQRTTREKLLSYLSAESARQQSACFMIPYDRQQLADYLAVDRSAMSHELSKLQKEGVLHFQRRYFELVEPPPSQER